MPSGMEMEFRYVLGSAADAEALRRRLGPPADRIRQYNFFFDTPERALLEERVALRLRFEEPEVNEARATLTFKSSGSVEGSLSVRPETERMLDVDAVMAAATAGSFSLVMGDEVAQPVLEAVEGSVGSVDPKGFMVVGGFSNTREVYGPKELLGVELYLDTVSYPVGQEVVEVEMEIEDEEGLQTAREALEGLMSEAGAAFSAAGESKYARLRRLTSSQLEH